MHASGTHTVEAVAKNVGTVAGDEVAELYLAPPHTDVSPRLVLSGFQWLHLDASEARQVTFNLYPRDLSQVDDKGVRAVLPGQSRISVGRSQSDGDDAQGVRSEELNIVGGQELPR